MAEEILKEIDQSVKALCEKEGSFQETLLQKMPEIKPQIHDFMRLTYLYARDIAGKNKKQTRAYYKEVRQLLGKKLYKQLISLKF